MKQALCAEAIGTLYSSDDSSRIRNYGRPAFGGQ